MGMLALEQFFLLQDIFFKKSKADTRQMSECIYSQSTGIFWLGSGERLEVGYSGFGAGEKQ